MPQELKLNLRLTADAKGFIGEVRVSKKELDKLTGSTAKGTDANRTYTRTTRQTEAATRKGADANRTYTRATRQTEAATRKGADANRTYTRATRQTEAATRKAGKGFRAAHGQALKYFGVIGGATLIANAARGSVRLADTYTELNNRLRLVSDSETGLARVREELFEISQRTRTELAANANMYSRIALAVKSLGRTETEVLQVTELLNKQVAIGGNNSIEAAAGLIQFAQGLASGRLQGDELRSVMENLLGVSNGLIVGFAKMRKDGQIDFDVTRKNIRDLAAEGVLSAELLLDAVLASADDTNTKFEKVAITVSGGMTQISNATLIAIGELDKSIGSSAGVSAALSGIASSIEYLDEAIIVVAASLVGRYGTAVALFARRSVLAAVQAQRLAISIAQVDGASRRAAIGMQVAGRAVAGLRAGMALLGGPAGIALLVAYSIYEFATANDRASDSLSGLPGEVDAFRESLEKLNAEKLGGLRVEVVDKLLRAQDRFEEAQTKLKESKSTYSLSGRIKLSAQTVADNQALAAAALSYAKEDVASQQQRLDLINTQIKRALPQFLTPASTTTANSSGGETTPEPLDAGLDKILKSLRSREQVIRDNYAAQINAVRDGGATLTQALADEGKTKQGIIAELGARQSAEITKIQQQQEQVAARARQQAWEATGLPSIVSRLDREQAVTIAGVTARTTRELALVKQHSAQLTAQGINSAGLIARIEAAGGEQIAQITEEATEERQRQEREAYDESVRLREDQQVLALASLLGFHDQIIAAEYDKQGRLAELQSEQLAQAAGFDSEVEQQASAHQKRLSDAKIDAKYRYVPKIQSIVQKAADFEEATKEKSGRRQLQTGLALAQESFGNLAAHSKKAFRLSQAAGIAQAIVATATGVANALSGPPYGPPWPLNYITAAAVGVAGFAQIAAIRAQQPPQAFAMGGVVDSPTFFSARNVSRGVAGESGPEGILPLKRLPGGKLGVGYAGGKQQHITFAPVIQVEVVDDGGDAGATGAEIGRGVVTQLEPMFRGLLVNELRPGGLLNSGTRV